jgi:rubrerythrin
VAVGEMRYNRDRVQCHLCGRWLRLVGGSHLIRTHGWTLEQYRDAFELVRGATTAAPELTEHKAALMQARIDAGEFTAPENPPRPASVGRWRSVGARHPELLADWDLERNDGLDPFTVGPYSARKVWWRCRECGHEWKTSPRERTVGCGCPVCGRRRTAAAVGENSRRAERARSLAVLRPDLLAEWHPTRNASVDPYALHAGSNIAVWWRCETCGHEWRASANNRRAGTSCPRCAARRIGAAAAIRNRVVEPERSIAILRPDLLQEWHPTRNQNLDPATIGIGSGLKVWWRCKTCGHEWQAKPSSRVGCPACSQRQRGEVPRERSLGVLRPQLLEDWHPTRNEGVDPFATAVHSERKIWWRCHICAREWQATPATRSRSEGGCRSCASRRGALRRSGQPSNRRGKPADARAAR